MYCTSSRWTHDLLEEDRTCYPNPPPRSMYLVGRDLHTLGSSHRTCNPAMGVVPIELV